MKITSYPQNICCGQINLEIEDNKIVSASFLGGCNGNLKGISKLIVGMDVEEVVKRLEGTTCGDNLTSCPDQLSICLKEYLSQIEEKQTV